jgi:hypothetical protein
MKISAIRLIAYLFLLISYFLFSSCKKENMCDCIKGTGEIIKEKRTVADFTSIEVHDNIYVTLTQDSINSVEVEAGENLLPLIRTNVDGSMLRIENDNKCNWVRSYKKEIHVYLHVRNLQYIWSYSGKSIISSNTLTNPVINIFNFFSGDISVDIDADSSYTKQMGAGGDISVTGRTNYNYIFDQGYGFLHLENLQSNKALVAQHGTGDIHMNIRDILDVEILSSGSVYYSGSPAVEQRPSSGNGRLIHE